MELGLNDKLEIHDNSTNELIGNPIVELFKSLKENIMKGSEFRKQIEDIVNIKVENDKKLNVANLEMNLNANNANNES